MIPHPAGPHPPPRPARTRAAADGTIWTNRQLDWLLARLNWWEQHFVIQVLVPGQKRQYTEVEKNFWREMRDAYADSRSAIRALRIRRKRRLPIKSKGKK